MMGGCVLRDASGNSTLLDSLEENITLNEKWARLGECNGTCHFGLENDKQVLQSHISTTQSH